MALVPIRTYGDGILIISGDSVRGEDATSGSGSAGSALALRGGDGDGVGNAGGVTISGGAPGVSANAAGGSVTITATNSAATGTGDGGIITLVPGIAQGSGAQGYITIDGAASDLTQLLRLDNSDGTNGAIGDVMVGTQDPSSVGISATRGSLYIRNPGGGTAGSLWVNTSTADPGTTWTDVTAGGGGGGVSPNEFQRERVQTSLSLISGKSVATPDGFWPFDLDLVEQVTGGAGFDFTMPGVAGNADAYSIIDGVPGGSGVVYGLFLDSNSMAEVNSAANWEMLSTDASLSISVWVRVDDYNSTGESQQQGVLCYVNRSSATIGTSTAPTYLLWFDPVSGSGGTYFKPWFGYFDNSGTPAFIGTTWVTGGGRPIRISPNQWVHLGVRRVSNGVNDVDSFLYVNGELVGSNLGQNDTGDPSSSNMRLIAGARMASSDELMGTLEGLAVWSSDIGASGIKSMYEIGVGL